MNHHALLPLSAHGSPNPTDHSSLSHSATQQWSTVTPLNLNGLLVFQLHLQVNALLHVFGTTVLI
jgi:hypothetical protein